MRLCVVVAAALASIVVPATPSRAIDYRLEIATGSFTTRIGERVILTVSTPINPDIAGLLTDPRATTVAEVSAPLTSRESVATIVGGGDFEVESTTRLTGSVFRATTLNDQPAFQLNITTSSTKRLSSLRISNDGVRAIRVSVTSPDGRVAQLSTFLNFVSARSYQRLPVYFIANVDGAPTIQPDGTVRVDEVERERLRDLRDLLFRKPPSVEVSVGIRPELVDGLTRSNDESDRQLLADLVQKFQRNDLLVGTFRPADTSAYAAASLKPQFEAQLLRGESVLDAVNGPALTTRAVWVASEPLDAAAAELLRGFGVTNVVAIGRAATAFGPDVSASRPYALRTANTGVVLSLADQRYARLLDEPTGTAHESAAAIAAELLAQRASIVSSTIGSAALINRQVILASSMGVPAEPLIGITLLKILLTAPQVQLKTVSGLTPSLEGLARIEAPVVTVVDVRAIQSRTNEAVTAVGALRDVLVTNTGLVNRWSEIIDVANDTSLTEARRSEYLQFVKNQVDSVRNAIRLPTSSFTFGSRESDLRVSLENSSNYELSVRLQLTSPTGKISFDPPSFDIVLPANSQREFIAAATARSNGLIPVELMLTSPSGTLLDVTEVRVRVNALASLGRSVSVVFLALLVMWWFVHARRRIKKGKTKEHPALRSKP